MEIHEMEVKAVRQSAENAAEVAAKDLNDLQLAIMCGGGAEVIFA